MRIKSFVKSLFVVGLVCVFMLTLTGCNKFELPQSKLSAEGVALENYLPKDIMIVMSVNKQDSEQKEKLDNLGKLFPEDTIKKMYDGIVEEIQMELDKSDLNFEEDIKAAFGEDNRTLLAINGALDESEDKTKPNPDMYIISTFKDSEKMQALIDKLAEDGAEKGELFGATTLDNEDDMFIAVYKDTILLTNKQNVRHEALKRVKNNEESVLNNELYKKAYEGIPDNEFADFYINYENYFEFITQMQEDDYPFTFKKDFQMAIAMGLYAEDEGVRMLSNVAYEGGINLRDLTFHEPYLYQGIPGKNLIMYFEVYDFKKAIELGLDVYEWDEEASKEMRKAELLIKKTIGIDLKEDVLAFMDKGFAMAIQRNETMIPAISFYIDASSNPEGAQKVIDILDTAISQAYDGMLATTEPGVDIEKLVKKEVVEVGKSEMNRFSLDFSQMSDEELLAAGLPSGIFTEPIEFYYGLTTNNYFVLSTYSGLDKDFGEGFISVGSTMEVEEGRELLKDYPYNVSYISVEETFKYIDQIFADMEKVDGPMDKDAKEAYDTVKAFLAPVKYMIGADQKMQSAAYLKMEAVAMPSEEAEVENTVEEAPAV